LHPVAGIFVVTITVLVTFLIPAGGVNDTALIFSLLIPVPAILLLGKRNGLVVLGVFLVLNTLVFILFNDKPWFPDYNIHMACHTAIVFVLISLTAYANEYVFGVLYQGLEKLSKSLKISQHRYKTLAVNKEKFVSLVSHSLGDHIGKFADMAALLNDEYHGLSEPKRRQLIKKLATISRQNQKLLYDLQKWATVQSDTIPFAPKSIKLEKIYREVTELYNPLIEEKKLSFFLKMKSNSEIFADENMVGAILRGLVSNAIKFSFSGGEVKISAREDQDKMVITVSDTGVGMSEKDLMRVNASFSFSTEGTWLESGTGIGLILVKEFLQKHHCDFHVESQKDEGTKITFTLPLAE
jgi:signal transduction histidine kinase